MTVLLYLFIPFLIGSIHWLLHNLSGQLTERKKHERKRVFGVVLSIVVIAGICFWVGLAAEADTKAAGGIAGRQTVMAGIAAAAGWRYIKCIWTPFEGNSVDQLSVNKSQEFMGLKFGNIAKSSDQNKNSDDFNDSYPEPINQQIYEQAQNTKEKKWQRELREFNARRTNERNIRSQSFKSQSSPFSANYYDNLAQQEKSRDEYSSKEKEDYLARTNAEIWLTNRARKQNYTSNEIIQNEPLEEAEIEEPRETSESINDSLLERQSSLPVKELEELKKAFDQGLIDDEEYSALKKQLLGL